MNPSAKSLPESKLSAAALSGVRPPEMLTVPASEFIMGTHDNQVRFWLTREDWAKEWYDKGLFRSEQPQHVASAPTFAIASRTVTNSDYRVFIWETNHRTPRHWFGFQYPDGLDEHPVTNVSWADAWAYCKWLGKLMAQAYRLPTEAEWELAARSADGRTYPWGGEFDPWRCNTLESGKNGTTLVGMYSPSGDSPYGVHDMAGNVWEWTSSLLRPYPYEASDGREDLSTNGLRVVRGGSWYYTRKLARCAAREGLLPTYTSPALGFRLALSVPDEK